MPFTFLAHQAPFVPLLRRRSRWVDGVCFTVGTMAPDFAYGIDAVIGTRTDSHSLPALVTFCVPVTLVVAWLVCRVLAPVLPDHLPRSGPFRFGDYRALSTHRFHLLRSPVAALVGALTHVGLDQFTHRWGWVAEHWEWYRTPLVDARWYGKVWAPFEFMQMGGHVLLSLWCVVLLARYGRRGWFADAAAAVAPWPRSTTSHLALWGPTVMATALGLVVVLGDRQDEGSDILRLCGACFVGLVLGSGLVQVASRRVAVGSGGLEAS